MRRAPSTQVLTLALALTAGAAAATDASWLQAPAGAGDLRLGVSDRVARVFHPSGRVDRIRLRRGETLLRLAEVANGWAAAGVADRGTPVDVFVVESGAGGRRLRPPGGAAEDLSRTGPAVVVDGDRLVGLAWLEGGLGGPLAVRVAGRDDGGWIDVTTVALPGAGSQAGLTATVLPDGRWLLVWSRFDGEDDEIVWSVGHGAAWSPPLGVHPGNHTPDVMPQLAPTPEGAVVVWNRLVDGEYRVLSAAFSGDGWTAGERQVSGPGGIFPSLAGPFGDPYVIYRDAREATWSVVDLDPLGAPTRAAHGLGGDGRPALVFGGSSLPRFVEAGAQDLESPAWEPVP